MMLDEFDGDLEEPALADAQWEDRVPPEVEWDAGEVSLAVADLVGQCRLLGYN